MKVLGVVASLALLVGCSKDGAADTSAAPATQRSLEPVEIEAVINIHGGQALGLAIDANSVWAVSYDQGTIAKIDPTTNDVVAVVDMQSHAASALTVDGKVWVVSYGQTQTDSALSQVDAASATLGAVYTFGEMCCDLSAGDGMIWIVNPTGSIGRFEPTGGHYREFPVTIDRDAHTNAVYSDGFVWVASDSTKLSRFDPATETIAEFDVGGGVPFLARGGVVWGASPSEVWAVDADGVVVERVPLIGSTEVLSLELNGPDLWVGIRRPGGVGAVLQIERGTQQVLREFRDIEIPARMVVGFESLWITDSGSSSLYRIGPLA